MRSVKNNLMTARMQFFSTHVFFFHILFFHRGPTGLFSRFRLPARTRRDNIISNVWRCERERENKIVLTELFLKGHPRRIMRPAFSAYKKNEKLRLNGEDHHSRGPVVRKCRKVDSRERLRGFQRFQSFSIRQFDFWKRSYLHMSASVASDASDDIFGERKLRNRIVSQLEEQRYSICEVDGRFSLCAFRFFIHSVVLFRNMFRLGVAKPLMHPVAHSSL